MSKAETTSGMTEGTPPGLAITPDEWREVLDILRRLIPEYAVWAFGSRVAGRPRAYSDLDLAIEGDAPLPDARLDALREAFRESPLPWKVDLIDLALVDPAFRRRIEAARVCLQKGRGSGPQ